MNRRTYPIPRHDAQHGFSLIVISGIIAVAALLIASMLPGQDAGDYMLKAQNSIQKLQKIEQAMKGYMAANGRRPCPADGQYDIDSANFGVEAANPGSCTGGTPAAPFGPDAGTTYIVAGTIPVKTLGLADDYAFDEWGRRFGYMVDKRATHASQCIDLTSPGITVNDSSGTAIDTVAALYLSYGADGHGAFPSTGSSVANRINTGSSDTDTLRNAFVNSDFSTNFTAIAVKKEKTSSFDDIAYYEEATRKSCCIGSNCAHTGFTLNGSASAQQYGMSIAALDLRGQGVSSLLTGGVSDSALLYATPGLPASYTTADLTGTVGATLAGSASYTPSAAAADIDNDGFPDLIISDPGASSGTGKLYVFFGSASGFTLNPGALDGSNGFVINGDVAHPGFGFSIAAGNVNNDSYQDIVASSIDGNGIVYTLFGHAKPWSASVNISTSADGTHGFSVAGPSATDVLGYTLATGDINGDSASDLGIGTYNALSNTPGNVYIIYGHSSAWSASIDISGAADGTTFSKITGTSSSAIIGRALAFGDVNNDGYADLLMGSPNAASGRGVAYLLFGKASPSATPSLASPDGTNLVSITGDTSGSYYYFGQALAASGDVDRDGYKDLAIGAPGNTIGYAAVIFGGATPWSSTIDITTLNGTTGFRISNGSTSQEGSAIALGDINGDGFADIMLGAQMTNCSGSCNGGAHIVYGHARPWTTPTDIDTLK